MHISQNVYWIHDNINYYLLIVLSVYCSIFPVLLRFVSVEFYAVNTFSVGKNARIFTICPYSLLKIRCFVEYIYSKTIYYKTFNSFSKKNVKKKKITDNVGFIYRLGSKSFFFFFLISIIFGTLTKRPPPHILFLSTYNVGLHTRSAIIILFFSSWIFLFFIIFSSTMKYRNKFFFFSVRRR